MLCQGPDAFVACHSAMEAVGKGVTAGEQASVNKDLVEFLQPWRNQIEKEFSVGPQGQWLHIRAQGSSKGTQVTHFFQERAKRF